MPEGHTLHRLALDHRKLLAGEVVHVSSPQGRFAQGAATLDGDVVAKIEAHGKHLLYHFESGALLHVHLGLFGRFRRYRQPAPPPRGAVRLRLETDVACLDLHGPTICELLDPVEHRALLERLGPDLLRPDASRAVAWSKVKRSKRPIGALLLDQSILSGVGNVYRAEALFVAGIHPETPGAELGTRDFTRLWKTLVRMLNDGVKDRAIITVRHLEPERPRREERTWVYGRSTCRRCDEALRRWDLASRVMYACETCQPR